MFSCCTCSRDFSTVTGLEDHAKAVKHANYYPTLACCTCHKRFVTELSLESHAKAKGHANYYPYHCCPDCHRRFTTQSAYLAHARDTRHGIFSRRTGKSIPEYFCWACGFSSFTKLGLQSHFRTSASSVHPSCSICVDSFRNTQEYNDHLIQEHPDLTCISCFQLFLSQDAVMQHFKESSVCRPDADKADSVNLDNLKLDEHSTASHGPALSEPSDHDVQSDEPQGSYEMSLRQVEALYDEINLAHLSPGVGSPESELLLLASLSPVDLAMMTERRSLASTPVSYMEGSVDLSIAGPIVLHQHLTDFPHPTVASTSPSIRSESDLVESSFSTHVKRPLVSDLSQNIATERAISSPEIHSPSRASTPFSIVEPSEAFDSLLVVVSSGEPSEDNGGTRQLEKTAEIDHHSTSLESVRNVPLLPSISSDIISSVSLDSSMDRVSHEVCLQPGVTQLSPAAVQTVQSLGLDETSPLPTASLSLTEISVTPQESEQPTASEMSQAPSSLLASATPNPFQITVVPASPECVPIGMPPSSREIYFSCRICAKSTCDDPTATTCCGSIFCNGCITQELSKSGKCPVCQKPVLLRLNVYVK